MTRRTKKVSIAGRFGARYGVSVKKKWREIMQVRTQKYVCPRCNNRTVLRKAPGIWECRKCGFVFAGGAYMPELKKR